MLITGDLVCFSSKNSLYPAHRYLDRVINGILVSTIEGFNGKWGIIYTADVQNNIVWISLEYVNVGD